MTSKSSKFLPYLAAIVLIASLGAEAIYNIEVDLETALPFLMALGLGGAGLKAVERAAKAKKMMPEELKQFSEMQFEQSKKLLDEWQNRIDNDFKK